MSTTEEDGRTGDGGGGLFRRRISRRIEKWKPDGCVVSIAARGGREGPSSASGVALFATQYSVPVLGTGRGTVGAGLGLCVSARTELQVRAACRANVAWCAGNWNWEGEAKLCCIRRRAERRTYLQPSVEHTLSPDARALGVCAFFFWHGGTGKMPSVYKLSNRHLRGHCSLRHPSRKLVVHHSYRIIRILITYLYTMKSVWKEEATAGDSGRQSHFPICTRDASPPRQVFIPLGGLRCSKSNKTYSELLGGH